MTSMDETFAPFTTFNRRNAESTGVNKVPCIVLHGVDKHWTVIYHHMSGQTTVDSYAQPIERDSLLKIASCSKLVTAIAALQCVERGLITLDEPVYGVLPELSALMIATGEGMEQTKEPINLRKLLTHSSGLVYYPLAPPALQAAVGNVDRTFTHPIPEAFNLPLLFEPGEGWMYSPGHDWTGLLIKRLTNLSLEEYFNQNIWSQLGLQQPYPTFDINKHPERKSKLLQVAERDTATGGLKPGMYPPGESPPDEWGGQGLVCDVPSYVAVLADIVSESPKLLKEQSIKELFAPHFKPDSPAMKGLKAMSWVFGGQIGNDPDAKVNYALGGLLITEKSKVLGTPANTLMWGGMTNQLWFANREKGFAAMYASHLLPPGEPVTMELQIKFQKDFWSKFGDD